LRESRPVGSGLPGALYDVTVLHFETGAAGGFGKPRFSKERRLDPQITLGLLTDAAEFPLTVAAFEGNKAETTTMVPVITAFKTAHGIGDHRHVGELIALQAAGCPSILGAQIPYLPDVVREWRDKHPGEAIPDRLVLTPIVAIDLSGESPRHPRSGHLLPVPP
jgi:hypothetical protein